MEGLQQLPAVLDAARVASMQGQGFKQLPLPDRYVRMTLPTPPKHSNSFQLLPTNMDHEISRRFDISLLSTIDQLTAQEGRSFSRNTVARTHRETDSFVRERLSRMLAERPEKEMSLRELLPDDTERHTIVMSNGNSGRSISNTKHSISNSGQAFSYTKPLIANENNWNSINLPDDTMAHDEEIESMMEVFQQWRT